MHRLFDPLVEEAAGLGAGLDWKTSLQELTATLGLGVPDYQVTEDGPDHEKTFTAVVRRRRAWPAARASGGTRRRPSRAPPTAAWTRPAPRASPPPGRLTPCRSCPRSRWSAAASTAGSPVGPFAAVEVLHPRAVRRHAAGAADLAARLVGSYASASASRRGKYLWLPLSATARPDGASSAHLGMSGQLLVQHAGGSPPRPTCGCGSASPTTAASCGSSTSARSAGSPSSRSSPDGAGGHVPAQRGPHRARPAGPGFDDAAFSGRAAAATHRAQAGAARPDAGVRDRQHLRRRGAVAGPAALGPADRDAAARRGRARARRGARGHGGGPRSRAGPPSTRSTSTSTARAATSSGSLAVYGRQDLPCRGAGRPSAARRS